jgi:hypothetical protein
VLATLDRKNTLIEVNGKLVYFVKKNLEMYLYGIEFIDSDKRILKFIVNLIKGYNYRGYNLFITIGQKIRANLSLTVPTNYPAVCCGVIFFNFPPKLPIIYYNNSPN